MSDYLNRCVIGDCRDSMRQMIADGVHAQICVTSPPYWNLRDYGVKGQIGLEPTISEYVENMVEVFRLVRDLLADDGTLWLNIGDSYWGGGRGGGGSFDTERPGWRDVPRNPSDSAFLKPKDLVMMPARVALALQADGWWLRQDIIWHKPNPMPESTTDRCTKAHEYLFVLAKSERYYWNYGVMREPAVAKNMGEIDGGAQRGIDGGNVNAGRNFSQTTGSLTRNRRSVWSIPTAPYREAHFAVMPAALVEPCILTGSRLGDVVLDPFFGSGTVGEVAQRLGRKWIGCDLQPAYAPMQDRRTAQHGFEI